MSINEQPHHIDIRVGAKLRHLRREAGLSQSELAERIGVSYQQVQKYEKAANRLSASMLWECAEALGAPVQTFF